MKKFSLVFIWTFVILSIVTFAESCHTVATMPSNKLTKKGRVVVVHKNRLVLHTLKDSLNQDELDTLSALSDSDSIASALDSIALDSLNKDTLVKVPLPQRLAALMDRFEKDYPTAEIGFAAYDLTADSLIYGYQNKKLYRPASTQKVLTAVAALDQLGPSYKFETRLYRTGAVVKGTLQGDLYVVGSLDPEFDNADMNMLADAVARQGIERIEGHVIGDVSMKDSLYWGSGWVWDDTPQDFQPYLTPLMFSKGYVSVTATPATNGRSAVLHVRPESSFYQVVNQTTSRSSGSNSFSITRNWIGGGNQIVATGNVTSPVTKTVNIIHTPDFFMSTFLERLKAKKIEADSCSYGEYSGEGELIASTSHSLEQVMRRALKKSDNLSAEAMFYNLGAKRSGSKYIGTKESIGAISAQMVKAGLNPRDYRIADGSGVSLYNYTTADAEVQMLKYAYKQPTYTIFYSALPIAGIDGTLRSRMKGTLARDNVHAKTGTVTGISSLAGYITTSDGHQVAFAIICTGVLRARIGRIIQDKLCVAMAE